MLSTRRRSGFTLIELMIVVAIIGILAGVAVPSFINYQNSAKRTEAYSNLAALAVSQKAFYTERGQYVGVPLSEPGFTAGSIPISTKRPVAPLTAAFASVGWTPDGQVFYDYELVSTNTANGADHPGCTCGGGCFTASAIGDLDGDGALAMVSFYHPTETGLTCPTAFLGLGPPLSVGGTPILDEVVRHPFGVTDDF